MHFCYFFYYLPLEKDMAEFEILYPSLLCAKFVVLEKNMQGRRQVFDFGEAKNLDILEEGGS